MMPTADDGLAHNRKLKEGLRYLLFQRIRQTLAVYDVCQKPGKDTM